MSGGDIQNLGGTVLSIQEYLDKEEILMENYMDLYTDLILSGKSKRDAMEIVKHVKSQEAGYLDALERDAIHLQISFKMKDLKEVGWNSMQREEKEDLLWACGMDVKGHKTWHIMDRRVREGNGTEVQTVVYGGERSDAAWLLERDPETGKRLASDEALMQSWR